MKKVWLFSVVLLVFVSESCNKSSSTTNYSFAIIGKWKEVNQVHWFTPTIGVAMKDTVIDDTTYWNFRSGGGHNLDITTKNNLITSDTTWSYFIQGNTITYGNSYSGGLGQYIQSINNNTMIWYLSSNSSVGKHEYWWNFTK